MQLGDFPSGRSSPQQPPSSPGLSSDPYPTTTKCPWMRCTHVATLVPTRTCLPPLPRPLSLFLSLTHTHSFTFIYTRALTQHDSGSSQEGFCGPFPF